MTKLTKNGSFKGETVLNGLFVDTSGWANLFIPTETHHQEAAQYFYKAKEMQQPLTTTNYIVAELVALLGSRFSLPRDSLFQYIDDLRNNSSIRLIHIDLDTDTAAWELCKTRPDKEWSLVDASSFIVMKALRLQSSLTTDRHFEQAGFIRLLK